MLEYTWFIKAIAFITDKYFIKFHTKKAFPYRKGFFAKVKEKLH